MHGLAGVDAVDVAAAAADLPGHHQPVVIVFVIVIVVPGRADADFQRKRSTLASPRLFLKRGGM